MKYDSSNDSLVKDTKEAVSSLLVGAAGSGVMVLVLALLQLLISGEVTLFENHWSNPT